MVLLHAEELTGLKKRLTSLVLAALRPGDRPYYVSDDQQAGLRVRVSPTGSMTWNVAYRIKGDSKVCSASLGVCDPSGRQGFGLAEARDRAAEILKAARQGRDLLEEERIARKATRNRLTVAQLIDRYAKAIRSPNRNGGALRTADDIERRLLRTFAGKHDEAADDIARRDLADLLDPVATDRPREAEKRRQSTGAMFRWGITKDHVSIDPTAGTDGYGSGDPRDRALSPAEIQAFWKWLDDGAARMPPDCIAILRLQLCTGARVGEIAGIDVREIHEEEGRLRWTLPAARSKNKRSRETPLVGLARGIIEGALKGRPRGPLFRKALSERALASTDIGHALKKRKLPFARFTSHDLRRTVVSGMDELGIPLDTIASVVGHQRGSRETRTLVRHYSRPRLDARIEEALYAWDARLREIVGIPLPLSLDIH